jgi:hypothetical protein
MLKHVLLLTFVFFFIMSYHSFPASALDEDSTQIQVKAEGVIHNINVADIPGFKEYLAELSPKLQELEKKNLRAWVPENSNQDTLIIGYACGIKTCHLSVLQKKPGTGKWGGVLLEKTATYQESVMSPKKKKLAIVTSQQVGHRKTKNTIYSLKVNPKATKIFTKIKTVSPKEIGNGNYTQPFHNLRFHDEKNFSVTPIVQGPPSTEEPELGPQPIHGVMGD